jgi:hypothetical protein
VGGSKADGLKPKAEPDRRPVTDVDSARPTHPTVGTLLHLQRTAGNAAVSGALARTRAVPRSEPLVVQRDFWDWMPSFLGGTWGAGKGQVEDPAVDEPADDPEPVAVKKKPEPLSRSDVATLNTLSEKLAVLATHANKVQVGGGELLKTRKALAATVKKALGPGGGLSSSQVAEIQGEVAQLETSYAEKVREFDAAATAEKERVAKEAAAQQAADEMEARVKAAIPVKEYHALVNRFGLRTLDILIKGFGGLTVVSLAKNHKFKTAQLEVLANDGFTTDQIKALLAVPVSAEKIVEASEFIPAGGVLLQLRAAAADEDVFMTDVRDAAKGDVEKLKTGATEEKATPGAFKTAFDAELVAQGLIGRNNVRINWMPEKAVSGDKGAGANPNNEQTAVTAALTQLDAGEENLAGTIAKRVKHENRDGHLPGLVNVVNYQEYGIAPPTGVAWPAQRRLVVDKDSKRIYYTWNHYGHGGAKPAFVRIR